MKLDNNGTINGDLGGVISLKLKEGKSFDEFCARYVPNYDERRFEAMAIRFYFGKEMITTLYAVDKDRQEGDNFNADKMPVKKFKLTNVSVNDVLPYIEEGNFTLTTGNYPVEDMEVMNK